MSERPLSAREFRISLERFKQLPREQFVTVQRLMTLDALSALQLGNPVRTGRSRASWTASAGEPSGRLPAELWDGTEAGLARAQAAYNLSAEAALAGAQLLQIDFGSPSFVVTNVEYVPWINARHPRRAGFVDAAVENIATKYQVGASAS